MTSACPRRVVDVVLGGTYPSTTGELSEVADEPNDFHSRTVRQELIEDSFAKLVGHLYASDEFFRGQDLASIADNFEQCALGDGDRTTRIGLGDAQSDSIRKIAVKEIGGLIGKLQMLCDPRRELVRTRPP